MSDNLELSLNPIFPPLCTLDICLRQRQTARAARAFSTVRTANVQHSSNSKQQVRHNLDEVQVRIIAFYSTIDLIMQVSQATSILRLSSMVLVGLCIARLGHLHCHAIARTLVCTKQGATLSRGKIPELRKVAHTLVLCLGCPKDWQCLPSRCNDSSSPSDQLSEHNKATQRCNLYASDYPHGLSKCIFVGSVKILLSRTLPLGLVHDEDNLRRPAAGHRFVLLPGVLTGHAFKAHGDFLKLKSSAV